MEAPGYNNTKDEIIKFEKELAKRQRGFEDHIKKMEEYFKSNVSR